MWCHLHGILSHLTQLELLQHLALFRTLLLLPALLVPVVETEACDDEEGGYARSDTDDDTDARVLDCSDLRAIRPVVTRVQCGLDRSCSQGSGWELMGVAAVEGRRAIVHISRIATCEVHGSVWKVWVMMVVVMVMMTTSAVVGTIVESTWEVCTVVMSPIAVATGEGRPIVVGAIMVTLQEGRTRRHWTR